MRSTVALAAWTLFVWLGRIRNAVDGDEGIGPIVLAATFVVLAAFVLKPGAHRRVAVLALAGWTTAVWVVRAADIALLSDRGAGFIVVHLVLAAVSIGLSAWAARDVTRSARAPLPAAG